MDIIVVAMLIWVVIGTITTKLITDLRSGTGYFRITPYEGEEGVSTINVRIPNDPNLTKKKTIILYRETSSQK